MILPDYAEKAQTIWFEIRSSVAASTYYLELPEHCVLDKKVRFNTVAHHLHGLFKLVHVDDWCPTKTTSLVGHWYFVSIINDYPRDC